MSFGKSKVERFPSYAHGTASSASVRKVDRNTGLHSSICTSTLKKKPLENLDKPSRSCSSFDQTSLLFHSTPKKGSCQKKNEATRSAKKPSLVIFPKQKLNLSKNSPSKHRPHLPWKKNDSSLACTKVKAMLPKTKLKGKRSPFVASLRHSHGAKCNKVIKTSRTDPVSSCDVFATPPTSPVVSDTETTHAVPMGGPDSNIISTNLTPEQVGVEHDDVIATTLRRTSKRLSRKKSELHDARTPTPSFVNMPNSDPDVINPIEFEGENILTSQWASSVEYLHRQIAQVDSHPQGFTPITSSILVSASEYDSPRSPLTTRHYPGRLLLVDPEIQVPGIISPDSSSGTSSVFYLSTMELGSAEHSRYSSTIRSPTRRIRNSVQGARTPAAFSRFPSNGEKRPRSFSRSCYEWFLINVLGRSLLRTGENSNFSSRPTTRHSSNLGKRKKSSDGLTLLYRWAFKRFSRYLRQLRRRALELWTVCRLDGRQAVRYVQGAASLASEHVKKPKVWMPVVEFAVLQLVGIITSGIHHL